MGYTGYNADGTWNNTSGPGTGGNYSLIPAAGRIARNLIHAADTVMSHITHFYHLAALDYVDASFLNNPAKPSVPASDMIPGTGTGAVPALGWQLVNAYVTALGIRRDCHTMGALLSGRQPIQNAYVPGGVTTLLDATWFTNYAQTRFSNLLTKVRNFINTTYIPNVLTVANAYGFGIGTGYPTTAVGQTNYFAYGLGHGNLLSYGDFDVDGTGKLALKRGRVHRGTGAGTPVVHAFDHTKIREYVGYSRYESYSAFAELFVTPGADANGAQCRHPWDNATEPQFDKAGPGGGCAYSWMKAPRYLATGTELDKNGVAYAANAPIPYEVGPLARVMVTALNDFAGGAQGGTPVTATDTGGYTGSPYNVLGLTNIVLNALNLPQLPSTTAFNALFSVLGRHGARAIECKFLADKMADWLVDLQNQIGVSDGYLYKKLPKILKTGVGLVEAPRGALGHWIITEKKKVVRYACVVPSTWNISPRADNGTRGAAEETIASVSSLTPATATDANAVINILRLLHPFDFCSACAIHVTTADKKKLTINLDTDGSVTVIPAE